MPSIRNDDLFSFIRIEDGRIIQTMKVIVVKPLNFLFQMNPACGKTTTFQMKLASEGIVFNVLAFIKVINRKLLAVAKTSCFLP